MDGHASDRPVSPAAGATLRSVAALNYDVVYTEARNRLTTVFRIILAIPHVIVAQVWAYLAEILAVVQWFIVLFTGKRNQGLWDLQWAWLGYNSRVFGYVYLLYDPYPAFGTDPRPGAGHDDVLVRRTGQPADEWTAVHLGDPGDRDRRRPRLRDVLRLDRLVVRDRDHGQAPPWDVRLHPAGRSTTSCRPTATCC